LADLPRQHDRAGWPDLYHRFSEVIAGKTRDEWERIFENSDACVAPILALGEVAEHPHNAARSTFSRRDGVLQPAPAPRFSRTVSEMGTPPRQPGADSDAVLADCGFSAAEIARLKEAGVVGAA
jgi:alpha-methylacyl-CoA racemase